MRSPEPADFGIAQEDIAWAKRAEQRIVLSLFFASALGWSIYGWVAPKHVFPLLLLRWAIAGFALIFVTAQALAIAARRILSMRSARYRRARQFLRAYKKFRRHERRAEK